MIVGLRDRLLSDSSSCPTPCRQPAELDFYHFSSALLPHSDKCQHTTSITPSSPPSDRDDHLPLHPVTVTISQPPRSALRRVPLTDSCFTFPLVLHMFNLTQSVSEPTHNQGHLLDLVFSKQSDNILISTKLHHGLTSDHTVIFCKLDVSVPVQKPETFSYRCFKKIDTGAFK